MTQKGLHTTGKRGKLLPVKDGFLVCPECLAKRRLTVKLLRIGPDTKARHLPLFCRQCKREYIADIDQGRSFESRSQ